MNRALLGAALVAAAPFAVPPHAHAASFTTSSGVHGHGAAARWTGSGVRVHRGSGDRHGAFRNGRMAYGYGYPAGYNDQGDYDANRSFDADKWNDWWHERPERSFPRWVWRNRGCTEDRMWWSGAGWRCTP